MVKGWPDLGCLASAVGELGLSVSELPTPVLILRERAIDENIAAFARWSAAASVLHAPHVKTTMAPELLRRQLAAGTWGLAVADVRQARIAIDCGASEVLIANEVARLTDLEWIVDVSASPSAPAITFCVDSEQGVALAEAAHRPECPPLRVLLEVGYDGGRAGVRTVTDALHLAERVARSRSLCLRGLEAFEGLIMTGDADPDPACVDEFLGAVSEVAEACSLLIEDAEPILSVGGSAYFDRVVQILKPASTRLGLRLVLRSGCYVTHDHGLYARQGPALRGCQLPRLTPAIEVRASVISRPQPDRVILNCGRRDVSYDAGLPVILEPKGQPADGFAVVALNDQHAHVECRPDCGLAVGDTVMLGISHPCTALERWRVIPLVDDADRVVGAIPTLF
jgi:D-serine deaminase-like pyridoxal phosphate-dependent protein